jgi:hypothetical protein
MSMVDLDIWEAWATFPKFWAKFVFSGLTASDKHCSLNVEKSFCENGTSVEVKIAAVFDIEFP